LLAQLLYRFSEGTPRNFSCLRWSSDFFFSVVLWDLFNPLHRTLKDLPLMPVPFPLFFTSPSPFSRTPVATFRFGFCGSFFVPESVACADIWCPASPFRTFLCLLHSFLRNSLGLGPLFPPANGRVGIPPPLAFYFLLPCPRFCRLFFESSFPLQLLRPVLLCGFFLADAVLEKPFLRGFFAPQLPPVFLLVISSFFLTGIFYPGEILNNKISFYVPVAPPLVFLFTLGVSFTFP